MPDIAREEVDAKLAAVEARIEARLANLEMIVRTGFAEMRVEMHKNTANLIKWGLALAIAAVGLNVGLITLVSRLHQ